MLKIAALFSIGIILILYLTWPLQPHVLKGRIDTLERRMDAIEDDLATLVNSHKKKGF